MQVSHFPFRQVTSQCTGLPRQPDGPLQSIRRKQALVGGGGTDGTEGAETRGRAWTPAIGKNDQC